MIDKSKILESWIMVEHLSEGDINLKDKSLIPLEPKEPSFYSLFRDKIEEYELNKYENGGIVLFCDVFKFREVVEILHKLFQIEPTEEEIRYGNKFTFALYFDKNLNFLAERTFYTESGYIRKYKKVPKENEFQEFEKDCMLHFARNFNETAENPEKFDQAMNKLFAQLGIEISKYYIKCLKNTETDATNLHSFFIDDLEKAKNIETKNLTTYLFGNQNDRINLDSKKDSDHFDPVVFEHILQPENYPLGRFPSNTKYALSLMQQVAVNLSIGFDNDQMRSVNGPPGTGKTTLLKDIFAHLIVQQAYDIAALASHFIKGTENTQYAENKSIGVIPEHITENNIVVASSNNGAVQNIVNELPLNKEIDEGLLEVLQTADYFREIINDDLSEQDENEEEKFWGTFSLEGGKSANITKMLSQMKYIYNSLEEDYVPDKGIYKLFLNDYKKLKEIRTKAQKQADAIRLYKKYKLEKEETSLKYEKELEKKKHELNIELKNLLDTEQEQIQKIKRLDTEWDEAKKDMVASEKKRSGSKGFLQVGKILRLFIEKRKEEKKRENRKHELESKRSQAENEKKRCQERREQLKDEVNIWIEKKNLEISELEEKVSKYKNKVKAVNERPLNMEADYEELQLSNPWFDEEYRIAQSELFISALKVRKQFLYENRKNIEAAYMIWDQQGKYLDNKSVIVAAWNWINMTIPVISSTFASFGRMFRNMGQETLGHLFIDEAGQALPQAAVGAIYRSRHVMAVGDPSQIRPVLTLDSNILKMLGKHFGVTEKYLSASASVQCLIDKASRYGFYRNQDRTEDSWIGIPLWVHRRCQYPMFTISNTISYDGFMVQGVKKYGKAKWFDVSGTANNKYVDKQGEFLLDMLKKMIEKDKRILDKKEKDIIYVITPFANVEYQLSKKLDQIGFTRYDSKGKVTNIGTVHKFQGKEAPVVFFVLGTDQESSGAARWAVSTANIMNVAATRAKEEFYIIGDRKLYLELGCDVVKETDRIIREYNNEQKKSEADQDRMTGIVFYIGKGKTGPYAYIKGKDGIQYTVSESLYSATKNADQIIQKGKRLSFLIKSGKKNLFATEIKAVDERDITRNNQGI